MGLLLGLSLKKIKLGAASFISSEPDSIGKQQLVGDDLQQLVGVAPPPLLLPFSSSSSPFSFSLTLLCSSLVSDVNERMEREGVDG